MVCSLIHTCIFPLSGKRSRPSCRDMEVTLSRVLLLGLVDAQGARGSLQIGYSGLAPYVPTAHF